MCMIHAAHSSSTCTWAAQELQAWSCNSTLRNSIEPTGHTQSAHLPFQVAALDEHSPFGVECCHVFLSQSVCPNALPPGDGLLQQVNHPLPIVLQRPICRLQIPSARQDRTVPNKCEKQPFTHNSAQQWVLLSGRSMCTATRRYVHCSSASETAEHNRHILYGYSYVVNFEPKSAAVWQEPTGIAGGFSAERKAPAAVIPAPYFVAWLRLLWLLPSHTYRTDTSEGRKLIASVVVAVCRNVATGKKKRSI